MRNVFSNEEPAVSEQEHFWDEWNIGNRAGAPDTYTLRLRQAAVRRVKEAGVRPRSLEVGCGTGWLSEALAASGDVVGVDLSPAAVQVASRRCPQGTFLAGDFLTMPIPGEFDFAVTADTIAHFADHAAFINRVAGLLRPGALFLLMSQNAFVWQRNSYVQPLGKGQIRRWPSRRELLSMLAPSFTILNVTSLFPGGGNMGIMRLLNSRYVWGVLRHAIGEANATAVFERMLLGRELAILSRRR